MATSILAALIAIQSIGQTPPVPVPPPIDLVVEGPAEVAPGDLAVFKAKASARVKALSWAPFAYGVDGKTRKSLFVDSAKTQVAFASGSLGTFAVVLAGASDTGEAFVDVRTFEVKQVGPDPPPPGPIPPPVPPGPNPPGPNPPPPGPTPPDDKFGLAAVIKAELAKVNLDVAAKAADAKLIAGVMNDVAKAVIDKEVESPAQMISETQIRLEEAIGDRWATWAAFVAAVNAKLQSLAGDGTIRSLDDMVAAWKAIAAALL